MACQKLIVDDRIYSYDPFPEMLGKYFVPYGMQVNNPVRNNFVLEDDFAKRVFPFSYTTTFQYNPKLAPHFRYAYMIVLGPDWRILKILKF